MTVVFITEDEYARFQEHEKEIGRLNTENKMLREGLEDFFSQIEDCQSDHEVCYQFTFLAEAIKENLR